MKNNDILNAINSILCCCGPFLLILILATTIGKLRARAGKHLPHRRKGFAGLVGHAQKRERERIKHQKKTDQRAAHKRLVKAVIATRDVQSLDGTQFEMYVGMIFERFGYQVQHTGKSNDEGIDLIVNKNEKRGIVQCKRYAPGNTVGSPTVRDIRGAMVGNNAEEGFLVTSSTFTKNAIEEAAKSPRIALIDIVKLNSLAQKLEATETKKR